MVVDVITFNGEYDLLEIRLNVLDRYVDQFIIVEAPTTFSGKEKPLYYKKGEKRYKKWHNKIIYHVIDEDYSDVEIAVANASQFTQGAPHWKHEFLQKESIKKALTHLKDNDVVFIGDCDEIWSREALALGINKGVRKLKLDVYSYYVNNRSSEQFWGTIKAYYCQIKANCLNNIRNLSPKTDKVLGWHFTNMGGLEEVRRKLSDSYTEETYWNKDVQHNLSSRHGNRDFLGRGFMFKVDESNLPTYLINNKDKYAQLFK